MRVYLESSKRAFQQHLAYRTANLAGLAMNAFWGVLRSFLFLGLFQGREVEAGWSVYDAIDYVWLTQALIMPVYFWNWWELAITIRTGDVIVDEQTVTIGGVPLIEVAYGWLDSHAIIEQP